MKQPASKEWKLECYPIGVEPYPAIKHLRCDTFTWAAKQCIYCGKKIPNRFLKLRSLFQKIIFSKDYEDV